MGSTNKSEREDFLQLTTSGKKKEQTRCKLVLKENFTIIS